MKLITKNELNVIKDNFIGKHTDEKVKDSKLINNDIIKAINRLLK